MLQITIPAIEQFNENTQEFMYSEEQTLELEHSLVSLSKWESKWNKPFLTNSAKTLEETIDYVRCMTLNEHVDHPEAYNFMTQDNLNKVNEYIGKPMTATTINERPGGAGGRKIITSELIYCWMISLNIPFECQYWHLNRLITLIKVCNLENNPGKKMSKSEILARNKQINDSRRQSKNTRG